MNEPVSVTASQSGHCLTFQGRACSPDTRYRPTPAWPLLEDIDYTTHLFFASPASSSPHTRLPSPTPPSHTPFRKLAVSGIAWSRGHTEPLNRKWAQGPAKVTDWSPQLSAGQVLGQILEQILMWFACMKNSNPSTQQMTSAGVEKRAENKKKGCGVGGE